MSKKVTLSQALKQTGLFADKKEMTKFVGRGNVTVDGKKTTSLQFQLKIGTQVVAIGGEPVTYLKKKYFVLNKPIGTSCQSGERFKYVVDFIDVEDRLRNTLFSIGRLDVPTTGLVIITNDGQLSSQLMEPAKRVVKKYKCLLQQKVTSEQMDQLKQGVTINVKGCDYLTLPAVLEKIDNNNVYVSMVEGKHRQIRKMWKAVGNKVVGLQRVAIGGLELPVGLIEGCWEEIDGEKLKEKLLG
jgi:16S rRNA pseudouridine516 synthase